MMFLGTPLFSKATKRMLVLTTISILTISTICFVTNTWKEKLADKSVFH